MVTQKYSVVIVFLLALAAMAGVLVSTLRTSKDTAPSPAEATGFGTVQEAFDVASRAVMQYVSAQGDEPVQIDPVFTSTLLSESKVWTIKGLAFSPNQNHKAYEWIVILNYDDMGQWQILAKTITPVSRQIERW